jgi:hypothetical protein
MKLTDMKPSDDGSGFDFTAEPTSAHKDPRSTKPKTDKTTKRGLKTSVLEQQSKPNGTAQKPGNDDISKLQEQQEA